MISSGYPGTLWIQGGLVRMTFAEWLKDRRDRARWVTAKLSEESGLSQPYITMLEKGERKPSRTAVIKIASALKTDPTPGLAAAGFLPEVDAPELATQTPKGRRILAWDEQGNPVELLPDTLRRIDVEIDINLEKR